MTAKMVIYFDCEQTRRDFLEDIGENVFWNDEQRDTAKQRRYDEATYYAFPDLESFDSSEPDAPHNRLNYSDAYLAIAANSSS
jgi:hypothetical protein